VEFGRRARLLHVGFAAFQPVFVDVERCAHAI
jgi:hypothetical protein